MKKYSQAELQEFQIIIETKLKCANEDLQELKEEMQGNKNGTDDTFSALKLFEEGPESSIKEDMYELFRRQVRFIEALEHALGRIKNKTYGVCEATGELIPKERLRAVPHARLTVKAKEAMTNRAVPVVEERKEEEGE